METSKIPVGIVELAGVMSLELHAPNFENRISESC